MKTRILASNLRDGSVLMVTLVTGLIIGVVLASYLTLVRHQNANVARSQGWNAALAAAEAGVEEAMAQLTHQPLTTNITRGANGWTLSDGSYWAPKRVVLNGAYVVRFTDTTYPVIYSTGYVAVAALKATLARAVEVQTTAAPVFSVGMAAIYDIKMNGNNVTTDSYISTNSAYSTDGKYDPTKALDNGDVASVYGLVNVGNGDVNGDLLTGPTGSNSVGANGSVSGVIANDFNVEYADVKLPGLSWVTLAGPAPTNIDGVTYDYDFNSSGAGAYRISGFQKPIHVGANASVTLYVTSNVKLAGSESIKIEAGGKLTIYMAGASFDLGGGGIINENTPVAFSYFGLPSNTSIKIAGNGAFTGTIYAPQADLSLSGGGSPSNSVDFSGASVTKTVTMSGHLNFHYDEALDGLGPMTYKASSWREL
jgi:hypothetical protein